MLYTVQTGGPASYTLGEKNEVQALLQGVRLLLETRRGSVPLYRHFGLPMEFQDRPAPAAELLCKAEVFEAMERFFPDVHVMDVTLTPSRHGMAGGITVRLEMPS